MNGSLIEFLILRTVHMRDTLLVSDPGKARYVMSEEEQSQKATPDKSSPTANDQQESKIEDKKLTQLNGEIGYFVKKGTRFVPVTNFSVVCTGYVTENASCGSSDGFLFKVLPKSTLHNDEGNLVEERLVPTKIDVCVRKIYCGQFLRHFWYTLPRF